MFHAADTIMVAIRRCRACGVHWFYFLREDLCELDQIPDNVESDSYDRNIWYVRLEDAEAESLIKEGKVPDPALFDGRSGFLMDATGMHPVTGIPDFVRQEGPSS